MDRNKGIIRTSLIGIGANVLLSAFKLIAGYSANSISIIVDGVNNLTDAASSIVTLIGTRLSEKEPDREHPFGHGRAEYLASLFVGIIILYAGLDALKGSIDKIVHPEPNDYSAVTLLVVSAAIVIKIVMGLYTKKKGRDLDSVALTASGKDALNDAIASAATLAAAVVYMLYGIAVEAWVGVAISLMVVRTGYTAIKETADHILGKSTDIELANKIKAAILSFPEVEDVYDIAVHNYGKEKLLGSAHIEVSDRYRVSWVDNLQRAITRKVRDDTGVDMLGISVCAVNTHSDEAVRTRESIERIVSQTPGAVDMHSFYIDPADKTMSFDVIMEFGAGSREALHDEILKKVSEIYKDYEFMINIDYEFTERE